MTALHPVITLALFVASTSHWVVAADIDYDRDVRPILSDKCFHCHGPDEHARRAGLRLDEGASAHDSGVIVPGDPDSSELWRRVTAASPGDRMPPPESKLALDDGERALLRAWIEGGAEYRPHWSFVALPDDVPVPLVSDPSWPVNEIDHFVLAGLDAQGWSPSPPASRERWLRRVTYDLTGLPPAPEEVDAFLTDRTRTARETAVARLLQSPRFGERMATPWLDAARYADSYGYQSDQLCPTWPYRDWVVRAFNDNLPFDDFVTWQLAGDRLERPTRDQRLATAFNRLHRMTNEGGSVEEEWRNEYAADRVHTFGTAMLGLTLECARCHDHKYDPITQRDYYQLYAFFNSIDEWGMYNDSSRVPTPSLLLPTAEQERELAASRRAIEHAESAVSDAISAREADFAAWRRGVDDPSALPILGLVGHYPLDTIETENRLANLADPERAGNTSPANRIVKGVVDGALELTGDDSASFPGVCGRLGPDEAFTVAFWIHLPATLEDAIILHRSGGTDVGFHGTEVTLHDRRLRFAIVRFWPGNAIAVEADAPLLADRWQHVVITYDASMSARGMTLTVDGRDCGRVLRDHLAKHPGHGGDGITLGERFRSPGLKGGRIDDLRAYDRALTAIERRGLFAAVATTAPSGGPVVAEPDWRDYYFAAVDEEVMAARERLRQARIADLVLQSGVREISVMDDLSDPTPAYVLARGAYDAPTSDDNRVDRDTPAILPPFPDDAPHDRLGLARWLTDRRHPLLARVTVNRMWQMFFGRGLVASTENLGRQGAAPSHPALLDWMARDFIESGWNVKRLCRRIALSATYSQDSAASLERRRADPENAHLGRGPSHRLPAETIRDAALLLGGLLDERRGGPPVSPYQPAGLWREANSMSPAYHQSVGADLHRRSLYTVWKRTAPMPNMTAFDAAGREVCAVRRQATNTPTQALVLWNDVQFVEAARGLAVRGLQGDGDDAVRVARLFRVATGRAARPEEARELKLLLDEQRGWFASDPAGAERLVSFGESPRDLDLPAVELAAWTVLTQTLLNLDAVVWKR